MRSRSAGTRATNTAVVPIATCPPLARFPSWIWLYIVTIGQIDGNIIAAIITTQAVT